MRVITLNCNGIRSAARKGLFEWLPHQKTDVLCLQELKAQHADLEKDAQFAPEGWTALFNPAQRKGYAGVGLYLRKPPDDVRTELGNDEFDAEGRYIEARYGNTSIVSLYLPSGSAGPERQASKDRFLAFFQPMLAGWISSGRDYIVCADWNIAHTRADLKNWRSNQKNSGFLPHERAWLDVVIGEQGWVDAFRALHPDAEAEGYTWWSNRGNAWANNVGWRIDYQLITPSLRGRVKAAQVWKDSRFSDHAPLTVDYADA